MESESTAPAPSTNEGIIKKHTLDSDEEDAAVDDDVLEDDDIEGWLIKWKPPHHNSPICTTMINIRYFMAGMTGFFRELSTLKGELDL